MVMIPDQYVDIDFAVQPQYVRGYDPGRRTFETREKLYCGLKEFSDTIEVLSESRCFEIADSKEADAAAGKKVVSDDLVKFIHDQSREGSCVGNGFSGLFEYVETRQVGMPNCVVMSPISLYKQIGSGPNSGAMLEDAWDKITEVGFLPLDTDVNRRNFKHVMPATGFYEKFPDGWKDTARQFLVLEGYVIRRYEEFLTAAVNDLGIVYGRAGHCIYTPGRLVKSNGRRLMKYANSWGDWGDAGGKHSSGFGYDSMSMIRDGSDFAVAFRAVKVPQLAISA